MSIDKHLEPLTRRLAAVLEPVAGQVYFAPECHENYEKLGPTPAYVWFASRMSLTVIDERPIPSFAQVLEETKP